MKWAVFFLCLLGILAAACAALLVNGMKLPAALESRLPKPSEDTTQVQVLLATRMIPAMTVVDSRLVVAKLMMRKDAPKDFISSTTDVVGKVLGTPLVEGQPFTSSCFAGDKGSRIVAEAIPQGKRAVGISVTDYAGLEGMLYPGSTVDVMASFKATYGNNDGGSKTVTLLENVQVLGVELQTVVSPGKAIGDTANNGRTSRRVTLLVDSKQAKKLQLAMENGTLSLALRNPMDSAQGSRDMVTQRELTGGEPLVEKDSSPTFGDKLLEILKAAAEKKHDAPTTRESMPTLFGAENRGPQWQVEVIRGNDVEHRSFDLPTAPAGEAVSKADSKTGS